MRRAFMTPVLTLAVVLVGCGPRARPPAGPAPEPRLVGVVPAPADKDKAASTKPPTPAADKVDKAALEARMQAATQITTTANRVAALRAVAVSAAAAGDAALVKKCVDVCPASQWDVSGSHNAIDAELHEFAVALSEARQHAAALRVAGKMADATSKNETLKEVASFTGAGARRPVAPSPAAVVEAARKGDVAALKRLLAQKADPNGKGPTGALPLIVAAQAGHTPAVKLLLEADALVNQKDALGKTALAWAARSGHVDTCAALLARGAAVNASASGETPLLAAVSHGHLDVALLLLEKKAGPNTAGANGTTPLMLAAQRGGTDMALALLAKGASPLLKNNAGRTAYDHIPDRTRHPALAKLLAPDPQALTAEQKTRQDDAAMIAAVSAGHIERVKGLLVKGGNVNARSSAGDTPLILAAGAGHEAMVQLLLDKGANHNATVGGRTALSIAASKGHTACVEALLENGAEPDFANGVALTAAATAGRWGVVSLLLDWEARPRAEHLSQAIAAGQADIARTMHQTGLKATPADLIAAVRTGNARAIATALACQANVNGEVNGQTALAVAGESGDVAAIKQLIDAKADVTFHRNSMALFKAAENGRAAALKALTAAGMKTTWEYSNDGRTPLMLAAARGDQASVQALLDAGASKGPRDKAGRSARSHALNHGHKKLAELLLSESERLLEAADKGDEKAVVALLQAKARTSAKDTNGKTALHLAAEKGHHRIVRTLLARGADVKAVDGNQRTPLHAAVLGRRLGVVRELLAAGSPTDTRGNLRQPLYDAVDLGDEEIVQALLSAGAAVAPAEPNALRPLRRAVEAGRLSLTQLLLDHAARRNIDLRGDLNQAIVVAVQAPHLTLTEALLDAGASAHQTSPSDGQPVVVHAVIGGNSDLLRLLLRKGADPFATQINGAPLEKYAAQNNRPEAAKVLDEWKGTPWFQATRDDDATRLKALLGKRLDVNARDAHGRTALYNAIDAGNLKAFALLLDSGADINAGTAGGWSPLRLAVEKGKPGMAEALLAKKPDVRLRRSGEASLLAVAAGKGDVKVVQQLLDLGADVAATDGEGRTPLMAAARGRHAAVVRLLLEKKAAVGTRDKAGKTALDHAGSLEVVELLKKAAESP